MIDFCHLHCHTQYSLLDGASEIGSMMDKALNDGQKGVALTDHGNMFGAFKFVAEANKRGLKPIIGCEFYMVEDRFKKSFLRSKGEKDVRYHQLMLAKNTTGYENLTKLCSLGYMDGKYGKYPRIDKELIEKYHEGIIATSCCLGAEVPQAILRGDLELAEKRLKWWIDLLGKENYYIEIQRHRGLENIDQLGVSQEDINQQLLVFAKKYDLKVIATNDAHYIEEEDAPSHDILLCVNTNSLIEEEKRFRFPSNDFYFKNQSEMNKLFADVPDSLANTMEIYDKIEPLTLARDVLLPAFPVPKQFKTQDEFLRHLTYEGAKRRYGDIIPSTRERLDFELDVIRKSGYPGYFLIVQDFTTEARRMGVSVGPGRGSAAGSAVAYCLGITNIDPIKYDLLFERFLNPERVSMPDIDIDFDDHGRGQVIDYVLDKYGRNQVAQIITYGTMAAKSSLRDVGRVMNIPLQEVDRVSKTFPQQLGAKLSQVLAPGGVAEKLKKKLTGEDVERAAQFRDLAEGQDQIGEMIRQAKKLEGSVRNTGIHACGVVITPDDITNYVPVTVAKDSDLLVSQFDNSVAEDAGLLKMDFLGLRTLSIIKTAVKLIKEGKGVDIDIEAVDLEDEKTYELFQKGETVAIFQYESTGMQKYLKELKPTAFEDIIAMNALYRPGPLEYIPSFIDRKHGREPITYDLAAMEEYLHETYGICVTGDTLIHDAKTGLRIRLDELEGHVGEFEVQGVDENLQQANAKITHWVCNGKKEIFKVKMRSGATVKLTSNHKVLTESGWQEIGDLQAGDFIATPRKLEVKNAKTHDKNRLRVLAYLIADGSISSKTAVDFISKDEAMIEAYQSALNSFERVESHTLQQVRDVTRVTVRGVKKRAYHEPNSVVQMLRDYGLKNMTGGCTSETKFIPEFVFGLDETHVAFFLACLWDCDGCLAPKLGYYKTISSKLANDVQTLLLRLGMSSTIYESTYIRDKDGKEMTAYQVTVYDLKAFGELIEPHLVSKSLVKKEYSGNEAKDSISRKLFLNELEEVWTGSGRKLMETYGFDRQHLLPNGRKRKRISANVVAELTEQVDLPKTEKLLNVRWDEIVSIEAAGEELVYDITVEKIHNFVGNNIILHNCVYQEQVMLLSQKLAGFTKGEADVLRKAMGKKIMAMLNKMHPKFIKGGTERGHDEETLNKIWKDWEAFASYAFNKSHSTCYAFIAFQTAYLKAHYPAEFMAGVLTNNMNNISSISFFLRECKRMGIQVLQPDINESQADFAVTPDGHIRYGFEALKGVGGGPVEGILAERKKNGPFTSVFDFTKRLDSKAANKKVLESLVLGGAFDSFEEHRAQYFAPSEKYKSFNEHVLKYGQAFQERSASAAMSLFGALDDTQLPPPKFPVCNEWSLIEKLEKEKEVCGIYISGHPLDDYRFEVESFASCPLDEVERFHGRGVKIAGIVTSAVHRISQKGTGWGIFTLQDYNGSFEFRLFKDAYQDYKGRLETGACLLIEGAFEKSWSGEDWMFKVKNITALEAAGESYAKSILVKIPLHDLNEGLLKNMDTVLKKYKGKQQLRVAFLDHTNRESLTFKSTKRQVKVDTYLVEELEGLGLKCVVKK